MAGRELRYLIGSAHGWLCAVGFGASALGLAARDQWIGWDPRQRRQHLDKVVCMNRFPIRNQIECHNLASMVLGMAVRQMPEDFRTRMGLGADAGEVALGLEDPPDGSSWASREFGSAQLGDRRLSKRLIAMGAAKARHPGLSWPRVFEGDRASTNGYYRFIEAPEDSEVQMIAILAGHRDCTIRRMRGQNRALCLMDGSDLDYSDLRQCEGLGVIGKNQTATSSKGLA